MFATVKRGSSGRLEAVSEGSSFHIPPLVAQRERVREGDALDEEAFLRLGELCQAEACEAKALLLLGAREHTRRELALKLRARGFGPAVVERTLDALQAEGSLSERRFCEEFVRSRLSRRPLGRPVMEALLASKGADRAAARAALDEVYTPEATAALRERAAARIRQRTDDPARVAQELRRAGFGSLDF